MYLERSGEGRRRTYSYAPSYSWRVDGCRSADAPAGGDDATFPTRVQAKVLVVRDKVLACKRRTLASGGQKNKDRKMNKCVQVSI